MKKSKLVSYVLPTIYVMVIVVSFFSVAILNNLILSDVTNKDYSQSLMQDVTESVLGETKEEDEETTKPIKPYVAQSVTAKVQYYNKDDDNAKQQNSLIVYQSTYMPSTGVLYSSNEEFDVMVVMDGVIKNINEDDIMGTVVEVSHNSNLTTYYYSLKEVNLSVGDEVKTGTILGAAAPNKIYDKENNLFFEVYYQGQSIDPDIFYEMNLDEFN